jgi:hypothetical protein
MSSVRPPRPMDVKKLMEKRMLRGVSCVWHLGFRAFTMAAGCAGCWALRMLQRHAFSTGMGGSRRMRCMLNMPPDLPPQHASRDDTKPRTQRSRDRQQQGQQGDTLGKMPPTHIAAAGSCSRAFRLLRPMLSDSSCVMAHSARSAQQARSVVPSTTGLLPPDKTVSSRITRLRCRAMVNWMLSAAEPAPGTGF